MIQTWLIQPLVVCDRIKERRTFRRKVARLYSIHMRFQMLRDQYKTTSQYVTLGSGFSSAGLGN
jgi:hypothetical protein